MICAFVIYICCFSESLGLRGQLASSSMARCSSRSWLTRATHVVDAGAARVNHDLLEQRAMLDEALVHFNFNEHGRAARRAERGGLQAERPRHPALMARVATKPAAASWFGDLPAGIRILCISVSLSVPPFVSCFLFFPPAYGF